MIAWSCNCVIYAASSVDKPAVKNSMFCRSVVSRLFCYPVCHRWRVKYLWYTDLSFLFCRWYIGSPQSNKSIKYRVNPDFMDALNAKHSSRRYMFTYFGSIGYRQMSQTFTSIKNLQNFACFYSFLDL